MAQAAHSTSDTTSKVAVEMQRTNMGEHLVLQTPWSSVLKRPFIFDMGC